MSGGFHVFRTLFRATLREGSQSNIFKMWWRTKETDAVFRARNEAYVQLAV